MLWLALVSCQSVPLAPEPTPPRLHLREANVLLRPVAGGDVDAKRQPLLASLQANDACLIGLGAADASTRLLHRLCGIKNFVQVLLRQVQRSL